MDQTIQRSGRTTPAKVKSLLFALANAIKKNTEITGAVEKTDHYVNCSLCFDGYSLSINLMELTEGGVL